MCRQTGRGSKAVREKPGRRALPAGRKQEISGHSRGSYITNPSLNTQMMAMVLGRDLERSEHGMVFEASCVAHMYHRRKTDHEIYYIEHREGDGDYEIYFVLKDKFDRAAYLFEVKMRQTNNLPANASILKNDIWELFPDVDELYRYVVYNGEETEQDRTNADGEIQEVLFVNLGEKLESYYLYEENRRAVLRSFV